MYAPARPPFVPHGSQRLPTQVVYSSQAERALRHALEAALLTDPREGGDTNQVGSDHWHRLSNGVTSGLMDTPNESLDAAELRKLVAPVSEGLRRIRELVEEARDVSVTPDATRLARADLASLVRRLVSERGQPDQLRVSMALPAQAWVLVRGVHLLETAVGHLLENACEGDGRRGASHVEVSLVRQRSGDLLALRVSDDGPGLPRDVLSRPGVPFRSSKPGHHGLGLYTCRRIALASGGRLDVADREGGGAVVELVLPDADAVA